MTVAELGILVVALVTAAVAGYQRGYRAGRSAPLPRPARPTLEVPQVKILAARAYDWETDE